VVIGGVGSIRGAMFGALLVGLVDTLLRAYMPGLLRGMMDASQADMLGAGIASMGVYLLMALVLLLKPRGLFPAHA
jgi:branched-chain amino acid transport system permease protein